MYNKATNKFLNSLRKKKIEAQVEFTLKVRERAGVTYYRCISYERQLIIIYTLIFRNCGGLAWQCSGKGERLAYERTGFESGL